MRRIALILMMLTLVMGCSQSGRRKAEVNEPIEPTIAVQESASEKVMPIPDPQEGRSEDERKTIVKMEKMGGVFYIPVEINGISMRFIFDTGASIISISAVEAMYLYKQGVLTEEDFVGTANFTDANGDISEGTIIVLKTVKIGDRMLTNVKASVVHNLEAPLLFGQSALESFGKISIDNKKKEITFE